MHCLSLVATVVVVLVGVVLPILFSYIFSGRIAQYISPPYGFHDIPNLTGDNNSSRSFMEDHLQLDNISLFPLTSIRFRHDAGKIAIVTGSNTGIGYVTARELARKGAKVIVAARNVEKGENAVIRIKSEIGNVPGASLIEFMKLDLSSLTEVKNFATDFIQKGVGLDMLILNAGVMAPDFGLTADGLETQIGTNHFGHFLLVKLLIPVIESSKARVVHVSSVAHRFTYPEGIRFESFSSDHEYDAL